MTAAALHLARAELIAFRDRGALSIQSNPRPSRVLVETDSGHATLGDALRLLLRSDLPKSVRVQLGIPITDGYFFDFYTKNTSSTVLALILAQDFRRRYFRDLRRHHAGPAVVEHLTLFTAAAVFPYLFSYWPVGAVVVPLLVTLPPALWPDATQEQPALGPHRDSPQSRPLRPGAFGFKAQRRADERRATPLPSKYPHR